MVISLIEQNPFRILGVYSNSTLKDRVSKKNRIKAYIRVGKEISFPIDLSTYLPKPKRSEETISQAEAQLTLQEDRLRNALFWFISVTPLDEIALSNLHSGNFSKAKEILNKRDSFSSLINLSVVDFIENRFDSAIKNLFSVISNDEKRTALILAVCGERCNFSEKHVVQLVTDALFQCVDISKLIELYSKIPEVSNYAYEYASEKLGKAAFLKINPEIEKVKACRCNEDNPLCLLSEALRFKKTVSDSIRAVKDSLGEESSQYQLISDAVANELNELIRKVLENNTRDVNLNYEACEIILNYASMIVVSELARSKIEETIEALNHQKLFSNHSEDWKVINDAILLAIKNKEDVQVTINLMNSLAPTLRGIESKLGSDHPFYIASCTMVVSAVNGLVVKVLNGLAERVKKREIQVDDYEIILLNAKKALEVSKRYPCDQETWNHLTTNIRLVDVLIADFNEAKKAAMKQRQTQTAFKWIGAVVIGIVIAAIFS